MVEALELSLLFLIVLLVLLVTRRRICAIEPSGVRSLTRCLAGLSLMGIIFAALFPAEIWALENFDIPRPPYVGLMAMVQTMLYPPLVVFAFGVVVPMFWYGPLLLRFLLALLTVLPGCGSFLLTSIALDVDGGADFVHGFALVMFSSFVVSASVALSVQLWTHWTLTHNRMDTSALPSTGIGELIQLTVLAAIGFAVLMSNDLMAYWQGVSLFAAFCFFATCAVIALLIVYFRDLPTRVLLMVGVPVAFVGACFVNGFFAMLEFGPGIVSTGALLIGVASLFGSAVACGVMWLCLRWMRSCRWNCVYRKKQNLREAHQPVSHDTSLLQGEGLHVITVGESESADVVSGDA